MTKVWAVMLVRDEADVIAYTVRQLVNEGMDGIIIANNRSRDNTEATIAAEGKAASIPVLVVNDDEVGHYQGRKTTMLAHMARSYGADWIVPCDADECWYSGGASVADYLRGLPSEVNALRVERYTHLPTGQDVLGCNPFITMRYRVGAVELFPKVTCRYRRDMVLHEGNHGVSYGGVELVPERSTVELRHFPYRSSSQLVRKIRNGVESLSATDLPAHIGIHWRQLGEKLDRFGQDAFLTEVWFQDFYVADPDAGGMVYDPAPYCRWSHGSS
jgi:glycosyltransferase involved in cell wall biosynthesis